MEEKEAMKCICSYLTGVMSEKDFISKYKKAAVATPENQRDILGWCIERTLHTGGETLQAYAQENDFSARMRLNLRHVTKEECTDKLVSALLKIAYAPRDKNHFASFNYSCFPKYKVNPGQAAICSLETLCMSLFGAGNEHIEEAIEKKMGKNKYYPNWLQEGIRQDLNDCILNTKDLIDRNRFDVRQ